MNQTICIAYKPGAFGSFLAWAVERFSAVRKRYEPAIMDNPLLPDGSSQAYASFCKIKTVDDFMQGLNATRWDVQPWHANIFAGWPGQDINGSVSQIQEWMLGFDRLIVVECSNADDHYLCYLRNEATISRDRWYGMLNISSADELAAALRRDISEPLLDKSAWCHDPRISVVTVKNILEWSPDQLGRMLSDAVSWPTCDHDVFRSVTADMQSRQIRYIDRLHRLKTGTANTAAEQAILTVYNERK